MLISIKLQSILPKKSC